MTRADDQARWRAKSGTKQINVQLSQTTVERLDALVAERQLSGRGEAITRLLVDPPAAAPAPAPAPAPAHELTQEAVDALVRLFKRMSTLRRLDLHAVITEEVIRRFPEDMKVERERLVEERKRLAGEERLLLRRIEKHATWMKGGNPAVKADLKILKQACHPDRREITPTLQSKAMQAIQRLGRELNEQPDW